MILLRSYLSMSLLLLAQFLLGMAVNLFVGIPTNHPGAHPSNYFAGSAQSIGWAIPSGGVWLAAHVSLGLALILGGIGVIVFAVRSGSRVAVGTAVLGGATILGAAFNGASFLDFNQDYSSMILAGLFALALGSGQAVTEPVRRVAGRLAGHSALEHPVVASCGRRGGAVAAPGDRAYPATSHHQVCARFGVARSVCAGRAGTETA